MSMVITTGRSLHNDKAEGRSLPTPRTVGGSPPSPPSITIQPSLHPSAAAIWLMLRSNRRVN